MAIIDKIRSLISGSSTDYVLKDNSGTQSTHLHTKAQVGLGNVDNTSDANKPISTATQTALNGKVDKVTGKGLSTNDYTTAEKNKLAGIEAGANKTVVDSALSSTSTNPVQNKVVTNALNTKFDGFETDSTTAFTDTIGILVSAQNGTKIKRRTALSLYEYIRDNKCMNSFSATDNNPITGKGVYAFNKMAWNEFNPNVRTSGIYNNKSIAVSQLLNRFPYDIYCKDNLNITVSNDRSISATLFVTGDQSSSATLAAGASTVVELTGGSWLHFVKIDESLFMSVRKQAKHLKISQFSQSQSSLCIHPESGQMLIPYAFNDQYRNIANGGTAVLYETDSTDFTQVTLNQTKTIATNRNEFFDGSSTAYSWVSTAGDSVTVVDVQGYAAMRWSTKIYIDFGSAWGFSNVECYYMKTADAYVKASQHPYGGAGLWVFGALYNDNSYQNRFRIVMWNTSSTASTGHRIAQIGTVRFNSPLFLTTLAAKYHTHSGSEITSAVASANSAEHLSTSRNLKVNLASGSAQGFDGSANAENIGVAGTLPIANGGTGATSASGARVKLGAASADDLSAHVDDTGNPHNVTKSQVGLGNVENESVSGGTPDFTEATARTNISSGETMSSLFGKIKKWFADLKTVAFTGSYNDLANKPTIPDAQVQSDWAETSTSKVSFIKNKPANLVQDANYVHTDNNYTTTEKTKLSGIASGAEVNVQADWNVTDTTSDAYIKNKPTIPPVITVDSALSSTSTNPVQNKVVKAALDARADKVTGATSGHFAGLDSSGNLTDSGNKASDFATAAQGSKADTALQPSSLDGYVNATNSTEDTTALSTSTKIVVGKSGKNLIWRSLQNVYNWIIATLGINTTSGSTTQWLTKRGTFTTPTASQVGAATSAQGSKADSAIQSVKVNGTALTPDSSKAVNIDLSNKAEKDGTYPNMSVGTATTAAELLTDSGDAWYTYVDNSSNGNANQRYEIWFTGSTDGCANILVATSVREGAGDPWPLVFVISCEVNSSKVFVKNPKVAILYSTNHSQAAKMVNVKYGTHSVGSTSYPAIFIKFADSRKHNMFISVAGKGGNANASRTTNTAGTDCEMEACVMTSHVGTAIGNASNTPVYVQPNGFLEKCSPMVPVTDNSTSSPEWNDFTETGVYQLTSSGGIGTKHSPESGKVGLTVVNAGGYITQLATGSDVYYRTRETSDTWHDWQYVVHSNSIRSIVKGQLGTDDGVLYIL